MGTKILWILACVPLYVVNAFCDKFVSVKNQKGYNTLYNCIKFFICSACMVPVFLLTHGGRFAFGGLVCGVLCGIFYAVSKTVMLKGYEATSVAFMTLCHSSGMIIPCIVGHFLWSEKLSLISLCGIVLTILSILLLKGRGGYRKTIGSSGIVFGLIIFLTSGGVMITQKAMGFYFREEGITLYTFYSFLVPALILLIFSGRGEKKKLSEGDGKRIGICALGSAVSLSVISFVMTSLASGVPSVILFPLFNGLGIIAVCISSVFVFKEKLNFSKAIGLILGVLGLYMINL